MRPAFIVALALGAAIVLAIVMAAINHIWAAKLQNFQILAGGLAALASALVAHDGQSAAARESRRKDMQDRKDLRIDGLRKLELNCSLIEQMLAAAIFSVHGDTGFTNKDGVTLLQFKRYLVDVNGDLFNSFEKLSFVPDNLTKIFSELMSNLLLIRTNQNLALSCGREHSLDWIGQAMLLETLYDNVLELKCATKDIARGQDIGRTLKALSEKRAGHGLAPPRLPSDIYEGE